MDLLSVLLWSLDSRAMEFRLMGWVNGLVAVAVRGGKTRRRDATRRRDVKRVHVAVQAQATHRCLIVTRNERSKYVIIRPGSTETVRTLDIRVPCAIKLITSDDTH